MNEYKQTLARFESALTAYVLKGMVMEQERVVEIIREYDAAKAALVRKLQYRHLAAEQRK